MSRAGYADFFPAAPSVLAKKAQAAKAAKEKVRIQQHDEYDRDRDISGALSAGSTASSTASIPTTTHSNSQLTPATSSSSPPDVSPRPATVSPNAEVLMSEKEKKALPPPAVEQPRPAIPTPKATPPAPQRRNCRAEYDPFLDEDSSAKKSGKVTYRYDGEGLSMPVQDPRKSHPDYTLGPKGGKRKVRTALGRVNWEWDRHYIGPGPPAQIMVTGLSPLTTESEILMNFRTFGDVQKFELKVDPTTGGSLGICSVIYRDSKGDKVLGHHSARSAVQKGNQMKIGMQNIKVVLDRDGMKCSKYVERIMEEKRKKQDEYMRRDAEAKRKEQEVRRREGEAKRRVEEVKRREEARNRPPPPPPPPPPERERSLRTASVSPNDPDSHFIKPRPQNYKAINDLGRRPAIFISSRYIPGEVRFCKHLYGRLKNFGVEDVLCDKDGFFVVFTNSRGLDNCFRMCDGDRLFSYQMRMKKYPRGNPNASAVAARQASRSPSPAPRPPKRKLERVDVPRESHKAAKADLKTTLASDIRRRIAEPHIYDLLNPGRLETRKKPEEKDDKTDTDAASTPACDSPLPPPFTAAAAPEAQPLPANLITVLPRFKKHKPKRLETPTSNALRGPKGDRGKRNEEARPLAHRLNHYDGSDDESTTTDQRPVSRGSVSRALSTDIGDDDSVSLAPSSLADMRSRKRKRSIGARTPSRLKDTAISTDDEDDEAVETASPEQEANPMEVDDEPTESSLQGFIVGDDGEEHANRKKARKVEATKLASDEVSHRAILDEDEGVDITSLDDSKEADLYQKLTDEKTEAAIDLFLDQIEAEKDGPPPVVDMSWTISSTILPKVTVEEDTEMIMDLDGLQAVVMDDEDVRFLKLALEDTIPANVGNVHLWACKMKERKAANREGKRGPTYTVESIEGFYRPNRTGCARTEGYRKIPEAEKSKYLPHRLAVAAKRANAAPHVSPQHSSKTTTTKVPVSSSRENRVNNRRLVQELNNQKQILCGDADIMRFNQLKKRKKPVRFARSAIHNWGLYAMENIPANDMIIEYVGEIVRQQVADMRERKYIKSGIGSSYLFRIDENTVIDATKKGGIARFINHSCTPNCTAKIIKVEGTKRIVIYALRDIKENEELTYDYKFERELDSDDRIPCLCGSSGCKGFLN